MATLVALLRAVNLGGRSMPMAGLREMLADLGLGDPRTLLQSGNAVFESSKAPRALEALLEKATVKRFALASDYFVRTAREWEAVVAANPFEREAQSDPSHLLVMPLKEAPSAAQVATLVAAIQGRERVAVDGRTAYIVYPDGIGRSKLTNAFIEARLGTRGTGRNWNTAQKIAALARARP
ncbi:MAG TPA: DUF1697 domain-containing protein [Polyangiaceae bacterium]|nr:DUF1697 domain-containing protein [Polyangiaceae bacterium]